MWSDDADPNEEWKKWKLVPAMIQDEEMKELEKRDRCCASPFPEGVSDRYPSLFQQSHRI
ncbi:MAG: hypothetical protein HFH82_15195 [Lachnospiraceae bacterium]|nr:hypothetical protein [Lachnospiraceae bacterium]